MRRVNCCVHNRCPDRPRWFTGRFINRPLYCSQCGRLWVVRADRTIYGDPTLRWYQISPDDTRRLLDTDNTDNFDNKENS